jgi:hypothetical protein
VQENVYDWSLEYAADAVRPDHLSQFMFRVVDAASESPETRALGDRSVVLWNQIDQRINVKKRIPVCGSAV